MYIVYYLYIFDSEKQQVFYIITQNMNTVIKLKYKLFYIFINS